MKFVALDQFLRQTDCMSGKPLGVVLDKKAAGWVGSVTVLEEEAMASSMALFCHAVGFWLSLTRNCSMVRHTFSVTRWSVCSQRVVTAIECLKFRFSLVPQQMGVEVWQTAAKDGDLN